MGKSRIAVGLGCVWLAIACGTSSPSSNAKDSTVCQPGQTQACFGPGQCAGAQTCDDSGAKWGTCDCGTGGSSAQGGSASTGGQPATGGTTSVAPNTTGGSATGGATSAGGASTCTDTGPLLGTEYTHATYGHGYVWGELSSSDYWIKFDSGLQYDGLTGYGWYVLDGSYPQDESITRCAAATVANITGWKLASITQIRTLAAGCASTVTGGDCPVSDSCLTYSCGSSCGSCVGGTSGSGPHSCTYCRTNVWPCVNAHTTSNCPDCAARGYPTEWTYGPSNGDISLYDPTNRISGLCVVTSVPNM